MDSPSKGYRQISVCLFLWIAGSLVLAGCTPKAEAVTSISLDFPYGGLRLLVPREGDPRLFYAELPNSMAIPEGIFDIDELYRQLQTRLHENAQAVNRPLDQPFGFVNINYLNGSSQDYLIYDKNFAGQLLQRACQNRLPDPGGIDTSDALFEHECANIK